MKIASTGKSSKQPISNTLVLALDLTIQMSVPIRSLYCCLFLILAQFCAAQSAGGNDPTFNPSDVGWGQGFGIASGTGIQSLQVLASDQVLVAGDFGEINRVSRPTIARLFPDGSTDTTFNAGAGANTLIYQLIVQPDQRILVCGSFTTFDNVPRSSVVRLLPDGALDPSFNNTGTGLDGAVMAMCLQPDGKIIVGGTFSNYNGINRGAIARLNADGTVDPFFANGTGFPQGYVDALALQADGSVVVGGAFAYYDGVYAQNLCRLFPDGGMDMGFSSGSITGGSAYVRSLVVQPDGKIILGGSFTSIQGTACEGLARILPDGMLDTSFITSSGGQGAVLGIVLQNDGRIMLVGSFNGYGGGTTPYMARLDDTGLPDPSFMGGVGMDNTPFAIGLRSDGSYIMGGMQRLCQLHPSPGVTHIMADGSVDTGYMMGSAFDGSASHLFVNAVDGIYATGVFMGFNNTLSKGLVKLLPDGARDPSFNVGIGFNGTTTAVLEQPDGKALVAGAQQDYQGISSKLITRLNGDGSLDTGFTAGAFGGANSYVIAMALRPDGRILASFSDFPNGYDVVQLLPDGSIDPTFNTPGAPDAFPLDLELQPDGKVLVAGFFTALNGIPASGVLRLNMDGSLDASFVCGLPIGSQPIEIALAPDGRITLIDGMFPGYITRLMPDGSIDGAFDAGAGFDHEPTDLALDGSGRIIVVGPFTSFDGIAFNNIARLYPDGSPDLTFDPGTGINNSWIAAVALQSTDKVIIAGSFVSYDGVGRNGIARVLSDVNTHVPVHVVIPAEQAFPNPAIDHIVMPSTMGKAQVIEVFNALGVRVLMRSWGSPDPVLDISALSPGAYVARSAGHVVRFVKE